MSDKQKRTFPGKEVAVEWDGRLCIHIAECGQANNNLFVAGRKPWADPDQVSVQEVFDVVERCPSGALTYQAQSGNNTEQADDENTLTVTYNGPYFVRGELELEGIPPDMPGTAFRAALCRCGQSANKPFCDNSHEKAGFKDYGAVGERGEGITDKDGKLTIQQIPDGPLMLSGNITIKNGSGRQAWTGTQVALCRCGASENKPFCDGSHTAAGFKG